MNKGWETECLVIGSGIAGLSGALALAERGHEVTVITAAPATVNSNTEWAQGGIVYQASEQDTEGIYEDVLRAGGGYNYRPAVRQLAELGPKFVREILIEKVQVPFDRTQDREFALTREAAHGTSRILHSGDRSGRSIEQSLLAYCEGLKGIRFVTRTTAVNLLMTSFHCRDDSRRHEPARCFGAFVFDQESGEVYPIFARHTVLATGGIGQLFLHNTNFHFARGDGIALGYRAGCRLAQLEYVQFHPTTFFKTGAPRFLISEAVRGEGGTLRDASGERFLHRYLPSEEVPELASRDKVAWAINQHMISTGEPCVFLDISHKPADWLRERFPFIYQSCLGHGVDLTREPVPVVPGAHYHLGGVWTDLEGRTSVDGLWAAGEVACTGLHGANRLASTSLLEGLVWGTRAGRRIACELEENPAEPFPEIEPWQGEQHRVESSFLKQDWLTLKHTMWNYVGLIKTDARLNRAEGILKELMRGIEVFYRKAVLSDTLIGLRHASLVAWLMVEACKRNRESRGCYVRDDLEI